MACPVQQVNDAPGELSLYIADGMEDNYPDGRIFEAEILRAGQNQAPNVDAGGDRSVLFGDSAALAGTVSDDGLPNPPGSVTTLWSQVSGPGTVTFAEPSAAATSATFSAPGEYVVRLTASDSVLSRSDDLSINVTDGSAPVTVSFQQGVDGYTGMEDAYITSALANSNFGTSDILNADGSPDRSALVK